MRMRFRETTLMSVILVALGPTTSSRVLAAPIAWNHPDGTVHTYQTITTEPDGAILSWLDAKMAAEQLGGYLATITTPEEQQFIADFVIPSGLAYSATWLGGFQPPEVAEPPFDQGWQWVTGEPWSFTNWDNISGSEPNDGSNPNIDEDWLCIYNQSIAFGEWNDCSFDSNPIRSFIVETPEPSTLSLLAFGALALLRPRRRRLPTGPQARLSHVRRGACLVVPLVGLFLGLNANKAMAAGEPTWMFRSGAETDPPAQDPPDMHWPALAFDSANNVTWLFGGHIEGSSPYTNSTWSWDGKTWTEVLPAPSPRPPVRDSITMAYDSARGVCVVFGGHGPGGGNVLGDTWEWDGTTWIEKPACASQPSPRAFHALAYDSLRGVVVLFGGLDGTNRLNDTWEWDGTCWTEVTPPNPADSPSARQEHDMAFDANRGVVVMFGGSSDSPTPFGDTWTWNGTVWTEMTPAVSPPAREAPGMAFDSALGVVVLFGGHDGNAANNYNDTWEWDGTGWAQRFPGANPPARHAFDMAYDSARQAIVVFGGTLADPDYFGDTWEYGLDCNGNGIPDAQDLAECDGSASCSDCNGNGVPDGCDIADSTSQDCQSNGIPDECETPPLNTMPTGLPLDTFNVPAINPSGATSSIVLQAGVSYWLLTEGTCSTGFSGQLNDAEWWTHPPQYPDWRTDWPWTGSGVYPTNTNDLEVDSTPVSWWGSPLVNPDPISDFSTFVPGEAQFSQSHKYWLPLVGNGSTINVRLVDGPPHYGDNSGSIVVSIYAADGPVVDADADGIIDSCDNCPNDYNPGQEDCDGDGIGDLCDDDIDDDGVPNGSDACPQTPNCESMSDGRPRLDLNNDCNVDGLDIQLIVQQMLGGCSACQ